jgi:hypothetical protein
MNSKMILVFLSTIGGGGVTSSLWFFVLYAYKISIDYFVFTITTHTMHICRKQQMHKGLPNVGKIERTVPRIWGSRDDHSTKAKINSFLFPTGMENVWKYFQLRMKGIQSLHTSASRQIKSFREGLEFFCRLQVRKLISLSWMCQQRICIESS